MPANQLATFGDSVRIADFRSACPLTTVFHSLALSGAEPHSTRSRVRLTGGFAVLTASRHSDGTEDMKVMACSSRI